MNRLGKLVGTALLAGLLASLADPLLAASPSLEQRIADRRAVEEVLWRHRVWPAENTRPKPSLDEVLPPKAIRDRVLDDLARSEALARFWGAPITPAQLRAEVERMAAGTRDPETLRELFAALGNDAWRVAECLARPQLADRLLRSRYAADDRLQAEARGRAERALDAGRGAGSLKALGGEYVETTWTREEGKSGHPELRRRGRIAVDNAGEWDRLTARLAGWFGLNPPREGRRGDPSRRGARGGADRIERLPLQVVSPLQETEDRFFVATILQKGPVSVTVGAVSWPKRSFEEWWEEVREDLVRDVAAGAAGDAVAETSGPSLAPDAAGTAPLPAITGSSCTDDQWAAVAPGQTPEERDSHTAIWTGTEMIVWGGSGVVGGLNTGGRYRPSTDTWIPTPVDAGTPSARWNHTAVWTGTEMIVWGGYSGADDTNTGGRYNPTTGTWTSTSTGSNVPEIREGHTAVWTGTEMIVWGGDSMAIGYLNSGGRYAPLSDAWSATPQGGGVPEPRGEHTAIWTGSEMIVWGGITQDALGNPFFLDTGGRYDPAGNSWTATSLGTNLPAARGEHTAIWTGTEMIVWGGSGALGHLDTGARYTPSPESWTPTPTGPGVPSARYLHKAIWTGAEMIVWGGYSGLGYVNSGGRYNPSGNSWTATSTGPGVPAGRGFHTVAWTGTEMIVWGGYYFDGSDHQLATGGRYNPTADSWTPTSAWADLRKLQTAVWTGTEMIVWGGEHARPPAAARILNSGGRYTPATNTWSSTSMGTGLPAAREYHTAVWTGTEMIVWGGYAPPSADHNSGGRYSPSGDSWTATSILTPVPAARDSHTAVWTGTEMIVWGGWNGLDALANGGRYSPAGDGWTAMATDSQRRYAHSAVWTGTEMIVWGGESRTFGGPVSRLNSGGRYSPGGNSWTATPAEASTPAPRYYHTAIWTGTEMIVWGGRDGSLFFDSGGRLTPGAVSWTSTSTGTGTPSGRAYHTAVWTGTEMIVWGGSLTDAGGEHFLDTGGRYDPAGDSWTPTATGMGAPGPRRGHTAIWTGSEMILWGGGDAASSLASGGRYCASPCASPPPAGAPSLSLSGSGASTALSWTALTGATAYDLVAGGLLSLRASGGNFATATSACLANDSALMGATDTTIPGPGDGLWYLVRGESCGGNGTYDSGDPGQAGSRDSEINASTNACP